VLSSNSRRVVTRLTFVVRLLIAGETDLLCRS
jgi:hypothetical protein